MERLRNKSGRESSRLYFGVSGGGAIGSTGFTSGVPVDTPSEAGLGGLSIALISWLKKPKTKAVPNRKTSVCSVVSICTSPQDLLIEFS